MAPPGRRNGIPDRWLDYRAVGKRIPGSRFIAFKVPLKQALTRQLRSSDVFGPWELQDALDKDRQELGLIIDLTFTTRYYNLEDIPDSWLFLKIFTAGHEIPTDDTIMSFKRAVHGFLRANANNDKLIGVHCTHGLNRTGYLICRYLIDVDGMDPAKAVELFNSSRGHAIERRNYLEDLQRGPKRSNVGMDATEEAPKRGRCVRRPSSHSPEQRHERQGFVTDSRDSWEHRSFPQRQTSHRNPPRPPLLPRPCCPPAHPPFLYQFPPPQLPPPWRGPQPLHHDRPRSPLPRWRSHQSDWRMPGSAPSLPYAPPATSLPRYKPRTDWED